MAFQPFLFVVVPVKRSSIMMFCLKPEVDRHAYVSVRDNMN
jgi:hypothetical protein